jgi:heavy metal sensor kinase
MTIRSIGAKLTIWYTSLLTVTFLVLGGIAYGLLAYSLARDMDAALTGVAEVMVQKARLGQPSMVPSDVEALFRRFLGFSPLERYFELFDLPQQPDPRPSRPRSSELPPSSKALQNAAQGRPTYETVSTSAAYPLRLLTLPVIKGGRVVNMVRVGLSMENMLRTRRRFLLAMAAVLPVGLLLAGGGGWALAQRALKPVDQMTQTAQRIRGSHLDQRLQVSGSGDELDRLATTLNDMLDRLKAVIHQMRQFSADASHELQTPLTVLKGEMEVALRSPRSPEEYQRVLTSGLEEVDRLDQLVAGLLLLARADAGVLRLDPQPVDLSALVGDVGDLMRALADGRGIDLQLAPVEPVFVNGDREHLRRLILNLVDNAVKYTPSGGQVTISLHSDADWAVLKVVDTGIGIADDQRQMIFDRFHRATDTRSHDVRGVGLGLSIARSIAAAHGGRIEVQSRPGHGSRFTVRLPLLLP